MPPMMVIPGLAAMENALILMALIYLGVSGAVGIHDAWTNKRGALGWILSIVASVAGGSVGGFALGSTVMLAAGAVAERLGPDWAEFDALLGLPAMIIGLVLGSWLALRFVNRFR